MWCLLIVKLFLLRKSLVIPVRKCWPFTEINVNILLYIKAVFNSRDHCIRRKISITYSKGTSLLNQFKVSLRRLEFASFSTFHAQLSFVKEFKLALDARNGFCYCCNIWNSYNVNLIKANWVQVYFDISMLIRDDVVKGKAWIPEEVVERVDFIILILDWLVSQSGRYCLRLKLSSHHVGFTWSVLPFHILYLKFSSFSDRFSILWGFLQKCSFKQYLWSC